MGKTIWLNLDKEKVDTSVLENKLSEAGFLVFYRQVSGDDTELTIRTGREADAVVSTSEKWNEKALSSVKGRLKLIMRYGAGIDNIDLPAATRHHISVANVPGANSAAVAEVALLHILNLGRQFCRCADSGKKNIWPVPVTGNELDGKTVGIVGFGNIAKQLVRLLSGFRIHILAYDPLVRPDEAEFPVHSVDTMEEIFSGSDIISLHIPLNDSTRGRIGQDLFSRMKEGAYLVNTCRGAVVSEQDLIEALQSGRLRGAGLDVMAVEPPRSDNPLLSMDNVYITAHMGAESAESGRRSQVMMADTIKAFFHGQITENMMNKELFI